MGRKNRDRRQRFQQAQIQRQQRWVHDLQEKEDQDLYILLRRRHLTPREISKIEEKLGPLLYHLFLRNCPKSFDQLLYQHHWSLSNDQVVTILLIEEFSSHRLIPAIFRHRRQTFSDARIVQFLSREMKEDLERNMTSYRHGKAIESSHRRTLDRIWGELPSLVTAWLLSHPLEKDNLEALIRIMCQGSQATSWIRSLPPEILDQKGPYLDYFLSQATQDRRWEVYERIRELGLDRIRFNRTIYQDLVAYDQKIGSVLKGEHWNILDLEGLVPHNLCQYTPYSSWGSRSGWRFQEVPEMRSFFTGLPIVYQRSFWQHLFRVYQEAFWANLGNSSDLYDDLTQIVQIHQKPASQEGWEKQAKLSGSYPYERCYQNFSVSALEYQQMAQREYQRMEAYQKAYSWGVGLWNQHLKRWWKSGYRYPAEVQKRLLSQPLEGLDPPQTLHQYLVKLGGKFQDYYWGGDWLNKGGVPIFWQMLEGTVQIPTWEMLCDRLPVCPPEHFLVTTPTGETWAHRLLTDPDLSQKLDRFWESSIPFRLSARQEMVRMIKSGEIFQHSHLLDNWESRLTKWQVPIDSLPALEEACLRHLLTHRIPDRKLVRELLLKIEPWWSVPMDIWRDQCQVCDQHPQHLELTCCGHVVCLRCHQNLMICRWCRRVDPPFTRLPIDSGSRWADLNSFKS